MDKLYLAIEIGGTKLQLVTGHRSGEIVRRWRRSVDRAEGGAGIRQQILTVLPEVLREGRIAAAGIGFGGPVDWQTGRTRCSHQIDGWNDFTLSEWMQARIEAPVFVDNDANVAALGEACHGAGVGFDPVFYVTLGSGVGGGLVTNEAIYHGANPGEAEIGHIRLDRQGTILESRCSGWAVDRRIREIVANEPKSLLAQLIGDTEGGEARHLIAALNERDRTAQTILSETAEDLAFGLSHVVHLVHPEVIVIGGGLSLLGEPLRRAVADVLPHFVMSAFHPVPQVRFAALGEDAVPMGGLVLARSSENSPAK